MGYWYYSNGTIVPNHSITRGDNVFTRTANIEMFLLNCRVNTVRPLGVYSCIVPDGVTAADVSASITIVDQTQFG